MATLREYLREENISQFAFADRIADTQQNVQRYCLPPAHKNARIPRPDKMRKIFAETKGRVTANDFYGLNGATPPEPVRERLYRRSVQKQARRKAWATRKGRAARSRR